MVTVPDTSATDCASGEQTDGTMKPIRFIPVENEASRHFIDDRTITDLAA
jgi:hypothetical protein